MAGKNDGDLRTICAFYAQKYKYRADALERGLEGYAAHLFAQEEGFDAVLDTELTTAADLSDYICRSNDLKIDVVGMNIVERIAGHRCLDASIKKAASPCVGMP